MPKEPRKIGLTDGKFYPCPQKKLCVSSQAPKTDADHHIKPLNFECTKEEAMEKIEKIVNNYPRIKILEKTDNYMRFEFQTALFRFKDDVEFLFENGIIHIRSQSRIGGFDWGCP